MNSGESIQKQTETFLQQIKSKRNNIQFIASTTTSSDIPALFNAEHERCWLCIWRVTVKCKAYRPSIVGDIRWRMVLLVFQLTENKWKFSRALD